MRMDILKRVFDISEHTEGIGNIGRPEERELRALLMKKFRHGAGRSVNAIAQLIICMCLDIFFHDYTCIDIRKS